jgi:ABC-type uncharacterized transport system YnjBCD ATPase subunit
LGVFLGLFAATVASGDVVVLLGAVVSGEGSLVG